MKLKYTPEMQKQDALHKTAKEDLDIMYQYHQDIINSARRRGFDGVVSTQISKDEQEVLTAIFVNEAHRDGVSRGESVIDECATCTDLIQQIEYFAEKQAVEITEMPTQSGLRAFTLIDPTNDTHLEIQTIEKYPISMMASDMNTGSVDKYSGVTYYETTSLKNINDIYYYKVIDALK